MASGTIAKADKTISFSPTVTKTSGNSVCVASNAYRSGNVINVYIEFRNSGGATAVGGNAFVGTISNIPYPKENAVGCAFYESSALFGALTTAGVLTIRVCASQLPQTSTYTYKVSLSYIVD